jgi:hypothetical protein
MSIKLTQNIYDHQFVNVTDIHRKQDLVNLNFMDKTINEMSIILMFFFVLVWIECSNSIDSIESVHLQASFPCIPFNSRQI